MVVLLPKNVKFIAGNNCGNCLKRTTPFCLKIIIQKQICEAGEIFCLKSSFLIGQMLYDFKNLINTKILPEHAAFLREVKLTIVNVYLITFLTILLTLSVVGLTIFCTSIVTSRSANLKF